MPELPRKGCIQCAFSPAFPRLRLNSGTIPPRTSTTARTFSFDSDTDDLPPYDTGRASNMIVSY